MHRYMTRYFPVAILLSGLVFSGYVLWDAMKLNADLPLTVHAIPDSLTITLPRSCKPIDASNAPADLRLYETSKTRYFDCKDNSIHISRYIRVH